MSELLIIAPGYMGRPVPSGIGDTTSTGGALEGKKNEGLSSNINNKNNEIEPGISIEYRALT